MVGTVLSISSSVSIIYVRIAVEIKKSSNTKLLPGYTKQLPTYQKTEKANLGVYIACDVGRGRHQKAGEGIRTR